MHAIMILVDQLFLWYSSKLTLESEDLMYHFGTEVQVKQTDLIRETYLMTRMKLTSMMIALVYIKLEHIRNNIKQKKESR